MVPPKATADASTRVVSLSGIITADILALFQQLLPAAFVSAALLQAQVQEYKRVYTSVVVMWLMVWQRLQVAGTLETAVLELVRNLPASFWPQPCKRLRTAKEGKRKLSSHTGAYNLARQGLSATLVEQCCDRAFDGLLAAAIATQEQQRAAFFLDGSSLRAPHREELVEKYPPTSNQHGLSHWPMIRILVAHDLYTGLAMRPVWGPMNGPLAVSEQGLLEQAIYRLPSGALLVGDANFGVFSVAYAAAQQSHPVVLRLTSVRARCRAGGMLRDGMDQRAVWQPSQGERKKHPQLPADACVEGRLIVREVKPDNGTEPFLLALFTTLPDPPEEVVKIYGCRWNIELDLRSLKSTLRLDDLSCTTPEMVAKEIDLGILAYNLVRAVMYLAAQKAGLEPRAFSFTKVRSVLNAFIPAIAAATDQRQVRKLTEDMLYYLDQCQLPKRKNKRQPYTRAVWYEPKSYPSQKG